MRLPRKNVIEFFGRPMIEWTIRAGLEVDQFDKIIVSTDDQEIADHAARCGVDIDPRPAHLAGGQATVAEVCLDLLARLEPSFEHLCVLYPTAPLRTASDIRSTLALLDAEGCS